MKKKSMLIAGILVVALVAGFFGYRTYASNQASNAAEVQTATVERGSITATLSASGNTRAAQSATIKWETSGKVTGVTLQPGDFVDEDQMLAELEPNTLSTEMIQAKQDLIDAQQALDDLLNSTLGQAEALQAVEDAQKTLDSLKQTAAEKASQAQLALAEAQEALKDAQSTRNAMNYPHTTDELTIEKAETDYRLAKKEYKQALDDYEQVAKKKLTNPDRVHALNKLVTAKQTMETEFAMYNWYLQGYTENEIAQADAEVAVAQANLEAAQMDWDNLKNGSSAAQIAMAEATLADAQREWERVKDGPSDEDVAAAQAAVDAAQAMLDNAQLLAPFTGTITEVDVSSGALVGSGDAAFRIDDLSSIYVDVEVPEVDLPSLEIGQQATLEFDAIPDKEYTGEVTAVGMVGTNSSGVVNYPVTIRITNADQDILPGMTASVTIIIDQVDNVLTVPNRAIRTTSGQQTVTVLFEGQQITVPVTVGLVGDSASQVTSDQLREGDAVVNNGSSASTSTAFTGRGDRIFISGPEGGGPPPGLP